MDSIYDWKKYTVEKWTPDLSAIFLKHDTVIDPEDRMRDRIANMDPPDAEPFKNLACAVILEAAKMWVAGHDNTACRHFFLSDDYLFWAMMAGIDLDGEAVIDALRRNGGVKRPWARIIDLDSDDVGG